MAVIICQISVNVTEDLGLWLLNGVHREEGFS